jgi:elongation factor G
MVERVLDFAIEVVPATAASLLSGTLERLASAQGRFVYALDAATGQFVLSAENESQLGEVIDHLRGVPGLSLRIDTPQVAYRETITRAVDHEYTHKDLSAGKASLPASSFASSPAEPATAQNSFRPLSAATCPTNTPRASTRALSPSWAPARPVASRSSM